MLLGELKANLDFDLVSELYIDKFNEKIKKLEDNQISNVKLEAKKEDDYIVIETPFYADKHYTYNISISEDFKIKIETFTTTKTDFESILHNINIVKSISSEILEEIKNEILKIEMSEENIQEYVDNFYEIKEKIQIQILDPNSEEYTSLGYNAEDRLIKIQYGNKIYYIANFENGTFKNIRINFTNIQYKNLDKIKEYMNIVLKAFEYYLYNKYNDDIYRLKYYDLHHRVLHMNNKKKEYFTVKYSFFNLHTTIIKSNRPAKFNIVLIHRQNIFH